MAANKTPPADQADNTKTDETTSAEPKLVQMPRAVAELHHGNGKVIAAGKVITDKLAEEAGLDQGELERLEKAGAVTFVEVYQA